MDRARGFLARIAIAAIVAAMLPRAASAVAPAWMTGFPLRAGSTVILMWTPVPGASEYRLYKRTGGGSPVEIHRGAETNFSDVDIPEEATVAYVVVPVVSGAPGDPSSEAILKGHPPPRPPTFTGTLTTSEHIALKWDPPPGASFFNLYRAEYPDGPYTLLVSLAQDAFTDTKAAKGKIYYYKVSAVDAFSRESALSQMVRATLAGPTVGAGPAGRQLMRRILPKGEFRGEPLRPLNQPGEIRVEEGGGVLVLDRRSIQFFTPEGEYQRRIDFEKSWGLAGSVAVHRDGTLLVAFHADNVVRRIDRAGALVGEIRYPVYRRKAPPGEGPPEGSAIHPEPAAPPADAGKGGERAASKRTKKVPGDIPNNPNGAVTDADGFYWIVDGVRSQVIKTDGSGRELAVVGRPARTFDPKDKRPSDLLGARKICYNPFDGKLYVILGVSTEIKIVDPKTAEVVGTYGGFGQGLDRFQSIGGLAFRKNGNILVLDPVAALVKEFTRDFVYVATYFDLQEKDRYRLSANLSTSIAMNEALRRIYVTSTLGNRFYVFELPEAAQDIR